MSLLAVVQGVCASVGVNMPTSVFSNITANRTMQEMLALANEMAQRISYDTREWTALKKVNVFTGDGVKTAFDLPPNFKRMLLTAEVWRSPQTLYPMRFIPDTNEWINRRMRNWSDTRGEWTIIGGQMLIQPALGVGITATFPYLDRNCIALSGGGVGDSFQNDADRFVVDERVLKLGMIWQWKAQKGSPYSEDMGTYGDALTILMGNDSPSPILAGRAPISANATVAYPWPVPTS